MSLEELIGEKDRGRLLKWLFQFIKVTCFLRSEISGEVYEPIEMVGGDRTIWHFGDGDIELMLKKVDIHLTAKNKENNDGLGEEVRKVKC